LDHAALAAPDLLVAECANILWKKVRAGELSREEALIAAGALRGADIEVLPTLQLLETATSMAVDLEHPAYDCVYLGLALTNIWHFVTADDRLRRKLHQSADPVSWRDIVVSLSEAADVYRDSG